MDSNVKTSQRDSASTTGTEGANVPLDSDSPEPTLLGQLQMATAFEQFSDGLWRIFIGTALVVLALGLAAIAGVAGGRNPLLLFAIMAALLLGGFFLVVGKQKCWSFSLPIRCRYLLTLSLGFDVALFFARSLRRLPIDPDLFRFLIVLAGFLSIWFLLRFLYHLAGLIESHRERWWAGTCQLLQAGALAGVSLGWVTGLGRGQAGWGTVFWLVGITAAVAALLTFMFLTATMAGSTRRFSAFLREEAGE